MNTLGNLRPLGALRWLAPCGPVFVVIVALVGGSVARAQVEPHGAMLRHPAVSAEKIAFVYADDIWLVDRSGGLATPLASPPGAEARPRFSPDGRELAFMGNYEGDQDLYVVPVDGGVARRVTHHPATEQLQQWTADGKLLFASGQAGAPRGNRQLFLVDPAGGLPERLMDGYGAVGSIDAESEWLAFTPHSRDHRTWKRYRGGMATDIWLLHLRTFESRRITDWEGTDTEPMWAGPILFYVSDQGPEHRWNFWSYDTRNGERQQVTSFADYDVKYPSMGPGPHGKGEIVFQKGSAIHLFDLVSGETREIEVTIPGDRPSLRKRTAKVGQQVFSWGISSTGKRALVEARGDIWTLPAKDGPALNLTRSDEAAERLAQWSPDGRWIAYFSDLSGEYEIWLRQSDGTGEPRQLGNFGPPFKTGLRWAPDSSALLYTDKTGTLYLVDVESAERTKIVDSYWGDEPSVSWSHDGRWIAYEQGLPNLQSALFLYDVQGKRHHQVTTGMFMDGSPTFDRKGDFLYYSSYRDFGHPRYEDVGTTFVYDGTERILAVPLNGDVELPWLPKNDAESWEDDEDGADDDKEGEVDEEDDEAEDEKETKPVEIDLDGFEARAHLLSIERGSFGRLHVNDEGALVFVRRSDDGEGSIVHYDPGADEPEEKVILSGHRQFAMSADGKKLLVRKENQLAIVEAKPEQEFEDPISLQRLVADVDPRAEWEQIFVDAWRMMRDFFYDPTMHGVDWPAIRQQYAAMLNDCASRADLAYVIREMISELNVGHAYYWGGDFEEEPRRNVGLLGVDWELDRGAYRIAKIYRGAPWDSDARSPLDRAKGEIAEGDYVLAVNGNPVDPSMDPWASFLGLADATVRLTVNSEPRIDDDAREVLVETIADEGALRFREWIERMRAYVDEKSGGRVGYIYVPNTGRNGQNELFRQFYGQRDRAALIVDERWNGGGQIPTRFIELLNRPTTNYWATRDGTRQSFPWPPDAHQGPKCMLINGLAGSGGDAFPAYFQQAGLGPLIGERTWGGLVGISGGPPLLDGAVVTPPSFAFYETDGTWGIEGHGVDPDVPVVADPGLLAKGEDPQLDTAIELMLREIQENPYVWPPVPAYPNRSGMGLPEEDM